MEVNSPYIIQGEESIEINGKHYWTISQFSKLSGKKESYIRTLISIGNSIRKIQTDYHAGKPFIPTEELLNYPFTASGRPSEIGKVVTRFKLTVDGLEPKEEILEE